VLAAQAMGADFGYIGSAFIATQEANAKAEYKEAIVASAANDIVYSSLFTGVHGNYLRASIANAGLDPENLPDGDKTKMNFATSGSAPPVKAWKDIWGCGQGIGAVKDIPSAGELVARLREEYRAARQALCQG
jgi:nitronate monooxygenase